MSLGVYFHIPYCIQRCHYCDFVTFRKGQTIPSEKYVKCLNLEIETRHSHVPFKQVSSVYFGGGTPSLLPPQTLCSLIKKLTDVGFILKKNCEITLEINPATITEEGLKILIEGGVNRFSVGVQTFNSRLLKMCGREHSVSDSKNTLSLLEKYQLNYSFDLLFGLPHQKISDLEDDLKELRNYNFPHLSTYLLTVPKGHRFSVNRPLDEEQILMFKKIKQELEIRGYRQYEISNFSKPSFESRHNTAYWTGRPCWGIGISSHSFFPGIKKSFRFWNPSSMETYIKQVETIIPEGLSFVDKLPQTQRECLRDHELLSDYCHTSLRMCQKGVQKADLKEKFPTFFALVEKKLDHLTEKNFLERTPAGWRLTWQGITLSNFVFLELTFLESDLKAC